MRAALTLIHIYEQDAQKVGLRAVDLASIARARHPTPPTFVIPCSIFEEFMSQSGIRAKLPKIYAEHPSTPDGYARAYEHITRLFREVEFSGPIRDELIESYESLALPVSTTDAEHLLSQEQEPTVLLVTSPTYEPTRERLSGLIPCVSGETRFLEAVKKCWLSLFTPAAVMNRQERNVTAFSTGIIVQQQLQRATVEGTYTYKKEHPITIQSYQGLPDTTGDIPKDEYHVRVEHLEIATSIIRQQPYRMISSSKGAEKEYLQSAGSQPSLDDKEVLEAARLTKRIHILLETDLTLFFSVKKDVRVLFCLRNAPFSEQARVVDKPVEQEANEELEEYDPDAEDLGIHLETTSNDDEQFSNAPDECIEEAYEELVAQEHPVTIIDEQDHEQHSERDTQWSERDTQWSERDTQWSERGTQLTEQTTEHSVQSAEHSVQSAEHSVQSAEHSVQTPEEDDGSLFDVYNAQRTPEQAFIINTHEQLTNKLRSLIDRQTRASLSFEELVDLLDQRGILAYTKKDVLFLARCAEYSQNNQPLDEHLGLAWRLSR